MSLQVCRQQRVDRHLPIQNVVESHFRLQVCAASFYLPLCFWMWASLWIITWAWHNISLLFIPSCSQPCSVHKQYHCGPSEQNHSATASVFHTQKAHHLNRHLTYGTERYSEAAFVHASAVIILELGLSVLRSHSSLIIISPGSNGGLHATWLMPHIDLM